MTRVHSFPAIQRLADCLCGDIPFVLSFYFGSGRREEGGGRREEGGGGSHGGRHAWEMHGRHGWERDSDVGNGLDWKMGTGFNQLYEIGKRHVKVVFNSPPCSNSKDLSILVSPETTLLYDVRFSIIAIGFIDGVYMSPTTQQQSSISVEYKNYRTSI